MAEKIDAEKHASNRRDELLVEQFCRGDESAFERIVKQYSADVAALANRLLGWPGDVEDFTQDIFLAAFLGLKKFRCECSLKSWLFTITINKCRSFRNKQKLRRLKTISMWRGHLALVPFCRQDAGGAQGRDGLATNGIGMRLPHNDTGEPLMDAEAFNRVRNAVAALPAKYREPVVLKYLQELDTDEICRILGISKNTLNVRLSRARKQLRDDLAGIIEL
jgi:RNA polymerase sigma factor (sigma-70 family)